MPADTTQPRPAAAHRPGPAAAARATSGIRRRTTIQPVQLTATVWPGNAEPLLLLDVDQAEIARLRPGFARDLIGDMLVIPHHPHARLLVASGSGTLLLHSRTVATAWLPASWSALDSAILAVLPHPAHQHVLRLRHDRLVGDPHSADGEQRRRLPACGPADRFLQLFDDGVALIAEIEVRTESRKHNTRR